MEVHEIRAALLSILAFLVIFVTFQLPPPNESYYPMQHRLFVNFHGEEFI